MTETHFAADFNFQDKNGNTPLYEAVVSKNVDIVKELIKAGADVNVKCENGNTALHRIMLCKDGDPKTEAIINLLLNNGQVTRKELQAHQRFHNEVIKCEQPYELLLERNRANIRSLNDMNKTALYYASHARKKDFGWQQEVGNVLNYTQLTQGDNKSRKDLLMQRDQARVTHGEKMFAIYEARRRKSK